LNDQFHGQGVHTSEERFVYVGEFRESKCWGAETLYDPSGKPIQPDLWCEAAPSSAVAMTFVQRRAMPMIRPLARTKFF
jgi:hypothetical protein